MKEVWTLQVNTSNLSSNKNQLQVAEKMIMNAREKQEQANKMHVQADKLQGQAQALERTGRNMKTIANREPLIAPIKQQTGAIETMNKLKAMFQEQPQKAIRAQSNSTNESVLHLLR